MIQEYLVTRIGRVIDNSGGGGHCQWEGKQIPWD